MSEKRTSPGGVISDRITGKLKKVAGAVLGDEQLAAEGQLHEERATANTVAARADEQAEQAEVESDLTAREAALATEEQELAAEAQADERAQRLEREEQERKARIARKQAESNSAIERNARTATAAVVSDEVAADVQRMATEQEAVQLEESAAEARARAELLKQAEDAVGGDQR